MNNIPEDEQIRVVTDAEVRKLLGPEEYRKLESFFEETRRLLEPSRSETGAMPQQPITLLPEAPIKQGAPPLANPTSLAEPGSLSSLGITRGGVIRNPSTKRVTQLDNPITNPRPRKDPPRIEEARDKGDLDASSSFEENRQQLEPNDSSPKEPAPVKRLAEQLTEGATSAAAKKANPTYVTRVSSESSNEVDDEDKEEEGEESFPLQALHPAPLETCFYGPLGEIAQAIAPHTEADPMALLIQLVVAFGSVVGYSPHLWIGSTRHYTNLFACLVGRTSKGRKGVSLSYIREGFSLIDPDWLKACVRSGTGSGEGIIWAVRDPILRIELIKKNGKPTGEYLEVIDDPGVMDKRLLVVEDEFARCLAVMTREHNTLSTVLRSAWDHISLDSLVKNRAAKAQVAHVSFIGHITLRELIDRLRDCEFFNGFANRFLWLCVRRARCLPEPPSFYDLQLQAYFCALKEIVLWAKGVEEMERGEAARKLWAEVYPELSAEAEGKFGSATARSEAQVARLSMIYALSTKSRIIDEDAQKAALALWQYAEDSARYLFDDTLAKPNARKLLAALRSRPAGMTRREINDLVYKRNVPARVISELLESLKGLGVLTCQREETGGRAAERWAIRSNRKPKDAQAHEVDELNEESL